jgi:competence protein ComEC
LQRHEIPINYAETGLSGCLGDFSWQVLSPHATASEASDSNDGSITMLWRSKNFNIITLADLGEKGQMRLSAEAAAWMNAQLAQVPLVMKVSHHGSADQSGELLKSLHPLIALISVGKGNSYGHPTERTLHLLSEVGARVLRTDELGSISVAWQSDSRSESTTADSNSATADASGESAGSTIDSGVESSEQPSAIEPQSGSFKLGFQGEQGKTG